MKDKKLTVLVGSCDKALICYKNNENIIYVRGIHSLEEIKNFIDIDNVSQKVILRAYNSFEDIAEICKDYEHNN